VIFTGAGILLNSVIEEKSSRILEVLLSSASAPEIMFGKILGAAGVSAAGIWEWGARGLPAREAKNPSKTQEVIGTGLLMVATITLVIWIAGRAFRAGALSTGRVNFAGFIAKVRSPE
jgi:ABC-2 type transport system permease protein